MDETKMPLREREFSETDKKFALALAREAIETFLSTGISLAADPETYEPRFLERRACFVTLTENGELRGCIGTTEATQELYQVIIDNAEAAAFQDDRFKPLRFEEFSAITIEISILTAPKTLVFSSPDELLDQLAPGRDGVILSLGKKNATYLPQVWEKVPDKREFLSSLCLKAGLPADAWQKPEIEVKVYQTEAFSEAVEPLKK